jgi:hypothetical protein
MDAPHPKSRSCGPITICQAGDDGPDDLLRLVGTVDLDGIHTGFFDGIVITAWEERIADVNHLF